MGRDFMAGIPGQVGGFARQIPGRAENAAGLGLDVFSTLQALSSRDPTALLRLQLLQSQAAQDPGVRSQLGSGGSPFFSGLLGLGVHSQTPPGSEAELARAGLGSDQARRLGVQVLGPGQASLPPILAPNLPPLSTSASAEQALQRAMGEEILRDPQAAARAALKIPASPAAVIAAAPGLQALGQQYPGLKFSTDTLGNLHVATAANRPQLLEYPDQDTAAQAAKAIGYAVVPTSRNTFTIRKPAEQGGMTVADLNALLGGGQASPPTSPTPLPAPKPGAGPATPAPTAAPALPPGYQVFPTGPTPKAAEPGYPSPAFLPGGQTAPAPAGPGVQPIGPAAPAQPVAPLTALGRSLPPGSRALIGPGGKIKSLSVPGPKSGAARATETTDLANLTQAKAALERVRQSIKSGSSSSLDVLGMQLLPPGSQFTGPVTSNVLRRSSSLRGDPLLTQLSPGFASQPLDVQFRQLQADVNDVNLARFVVTGKRLTQAEITVFEGSLPDVRQPPEVFRALVDRMGVFIDAMLNLKQALADLPQAQRDAVESNYIRATLAQWQQAPLGAAAAPGAP